MARRAGVAFLNVTPRITIRSAIERTWKSSAHHFSSPTNEALAYTSVDRVSRGGAHLHAKQALLDDIVAGGRKEGVNEFVTCHMAGMSIVRCSAVS